MVTELDYMEYANDGAAQAAYVSSGAAEAQTITNTDEDDYQAIGDVSDTEYRWAQEFTLTEISLMDKVDIKFAADIGSPTGNFTVRIETDDSNKPSGTLAHANATKTFTRVESSVNTVDFTDFTLAAGIYWIVSVVDNQDTGDRFNWGMSGATPTDLIGDVGWSRSTESGGAWLIYSTTRSFTMTIYFTRDNLQCYSESSIKEQGDYSLKGVALITNSLNDTLTRTGLSIDLTDLTEIKYDIRGSRTGSQIKIGIHDAGGTTTENTANISSANVWQTETWDISGVSNANKDAIDSIIITVVNADVANTFYIDNIYAETVVEVNAIFFGANF